MRPIRQYIEDFPSIERDACFCSVDESTRALLEKAAAEISKRPDLLADMEAIDTALTGDNAEWAAAPWRRSVEKGASPGESFLLAFPILHHLSHIRAFYEARKIPERYLRAVMSDFQRWIVTHREWTMGVPGFTEISWLREHVCGRIFEIGRLQFQPSRWTSTPTIPLINSRTQERLLLAKADKDAVTTEGGFASALGANQEGTVPLVCQETPETITGHRIFTDGTISRTPERFSTNEWKRILNDGDPVINIHIPCGTPLKPNACRESIREALQFFPKYFPDWPIAHAKALLCVSWLLYPDFQKILAPTSNIVGFQKFFHPFPVPKAGDQQFYERIFMPWNREITRDKLKTSLQRALFDHIASGHTPHGGGGLIFPDEFSGNTAGSPR